MQKIKINSIGADPEILIKKENEVVPCIGIFEGSKGTPENYNYKDTNVGIQEDNVMLEFNTTPATTKEDFVKHVSQAFECCVYLLESKGYSPLVKSSHTFDWSQLEHPQALTSGCDPDNNAWSEELVVGCDMATTPLRAAGGHIHIGHSGGDDPIINAEIVKHLDLNLGLVDVIINEDKERRTLYGKAGAFRNKPYGLEYRTPSNFWIKEDKYIELVWDLAHKAVEDYNNNVSISDELGAEIQEAINTGNSEQAKSILEKCNINFKVYEKYAELEKV